MPIRLTPTPRAVIMGRRRKKKTTKEDLGFNVPNNDMNYVDFVNYENTHNI